MSTEIWLNEPHLQKVMKVIDRAGGDIRVAGGAVRNALLGVPISDVDLATTMLPQDVMRVCKAAGFGVHPTGLEHGTITVVNGRQAFEITTLRRDVETDGRRAVVVFTTDWAEDARRRDFTINALFCDATGKIYDYTTGLQDIARRRVRFVGDSAARIKEDYLRILRFFRFSAYYAKGPLCPVGLAECTRLKKGLKKISAERIRQEMMKIMVAPKAVAILQIMATKKILSEIIPHTEDWSTLGRLPADAILRLFVLVKKPQLLKENLRLSNEEALRIAALIAAPEISTNLRATETRSMLYRMGEQVWRDGVYMAWAKSSARMNNLKWQALLDLPRHWDIPKFPLTGKDLITVGISPGPQMGEQLQALEDWWVASDFAPTREELLNRIENGN